MIIKLHAYFLLVFSAFFTPLFSQNTLSFELNEPIEIVNPPYFYWDLLREKNPEWIRESIHGLTGNWINLNRVISDKDADGRFTYLEYQTWNSDSSKWKSPYQFKYEYTIDANNRLTGMKKETLSLTNTETQITFIYDGTGKIIKASYTYNGTPSMECFFSYNAQEQRVADTTRSPQDSSVIYVQHHEYDANGNCIQNTWFQELGFGMDTIRIEKYTHNGSHITSIEQYNIGSIGFPLYLSTRTEFTYSGTNIKDVVVYGYDTSATLVPKEVYKHYYSGGKLAGMSRVFYDLGVIKPKDSVALYYNANGQLDTGYQYDSAGSGWQILPSYRLTFKKLSTGMAEIARFGGLSVYPNPVADYITIEIETLNNGDFSLDITDATGKRVKAVYTVNMAAGKNTIRIPVQDMAPGIYYLTSGADTVKFVKE